MITRWDTMLPIPLMDQEQDRVLAELEKVGIIQTSKEEDPTRRLPLA